MNKQAVKEHFVRNKKVYLVGGICLTAGIVSTAVLMKHQIVVTDALKGFEFKFNSPTTNVVTTSLERRGHPGNVTKCLTTGEVFASQNRAANVMNINPWVLSRHVRGLIPDAEGYKFEILGEA